MDFEMNDEQKMIIETARKIAQTYGPEYWLKKEDEHTFPWDFYKAIGDVGFLGLGIPTEYGGSGLGLTEGTIAFEEMGSSGGGSGPALLYLMGCVFGGQSILKHGSEEQKRKYLPKISSGEMTVCLGLTEPDAGTNTLKVRTFAQKDGDEYVINGNKMFISGFEDAGAMILVTRTTKFEDSPKKTLGLSLFLVDLPTPAIQCTEIPKHAGNYVPTYELGIDGLRVPRESLLGEEGKGWYHVLDTLNPERILVATSALGAARLSITKAVEYANQRKVFDCVIGAHQGVQHPLASAYAKLQCAWLGVLKSAVLFDQGASAKKVGDIANMSKYVAVEASHEAIYHAMQTLGGYGFTKEYHIERWWREVQLTRLAPITQQMTLNYTAEHILGMPRSY